MTNGELIEELSRYARHLPVKVVISTFYGAYDATGQFVDDLEIDLSPEDAIEASHVTHGGNFLLIESK
jgi:hypothetical protein